MNTERILEGVEVLIPRRFHRRHQAAVEGACADFAALIAALPAASPPSMDAATSALAGADADECKAWIARAIRALPTRTGTEADDGAA